MDFLCTLSFVPSIAAGSAARELLSSPSCRSCCRDLAIVELARKLHAYLAIENGVRFAVRYAVTGEYNLIYCVDGPDRVPWPAMEMDSAEEDAAREPSIEARAAGASASVMRDWTVLCTQRPALRDAGLSTSEVCLCRRRRVGGPDSHPVAVGSGTFTPAECDPNKMPVARATVPGDHRLPAPLIAR
jgi:hypothetical protein